MSDVATPSDRAPWMRSQLTKLLSQDGHALLLHGPSGLGQFRLAMELAKAWLCERPTAHGACHQCASCHAVDVHTHPDLRVLLPELEALERGWPLGEKAQTEIDEKKRKPGKEIRIDALRDTIEFSQRTSAKGQGKVVVLFPAEMMNPISANALLKTLEEPPGDTRFVLATRNAHLLLPTIRSRCLSHSMVFPHRGEAQHWLQSRGVPVGAAEVWLAASGDRPEDALALASEGLSPDVWLAFPKAMRQGDMSAVKDWSPVRLMVSLHKLCHDQLAMAYGGQPRFFPASALVSDCSAFRLLNWSKALCGGMRSVEHPYSAGLMLDALVNQARLALHSSRQPAS